MRDSEFGSPANLQVPPSAWMQQNPVIKALSDRDKITYKFSYLQYTEHREHSSDQYLLVISIS